MQDQLFSDLEAADWRKILDIINEVDLGIKLISIKKYLVTKIELIKTKCRGGKETSIFKRKKLRNLYV